MGYVERNAGGWTELRVHGVAGTAPESVLEHPHAAQVAGNDDAGFLRRLWEARSVSADTPRRRREAYSWGGLTSGDNTRALWLLLLPFMLLNVAFYMTPHRRPPGSTDRTDQRRDRAAAAVQRLLALSFTATFTLTTIGVAMDLVGWQCAAGRPRGADVCGISWLSWLTWAWLDQPGRQVAVTALVPLAVAGLLWGLAGSTWNRMESVEITQAPPGYETEIRTPLEDRAMWNGRATVRRLRAVHVATAVTLPGVFALATTGWSAGWPLLAPQLVLLAGMVVLVVVPGPWSRRTPDADSPAEREQKQRQRAGERRDRWHWMPRIALVLTAAALVAVCVGDTVEPAGTLPWLVMTVQGLFVAQALLLLALLGICTRLARRAAQVRGEERPAPDPAHRPVDTRPVWRGLAMPAVAMLAWVLAGGFSAGVVLRTAQTLGTPVARGQLSGEPYPLVVPTAYQWVAVAALALGVVAVLVGVVAWWRLGRAAALASVEPTVELAYGPAARANPQRSDEIARAWARATALRGEVERALGVLLVLTVVVLVAGVVGFMSYGPRLLSEASPLVAVASLALTGFVVGLLAVGRQAYRSPATRRSVGIIWDLGTFWPRAVHPLAPPCYAERALPDLMLRLRHLTMGGRVLLSCHSQGSVLGAALLLQVERPVSARTALLTYGSPLARLYGRFFPVYFSRETFTRLGLLLSNDPADTARTAWRWRNLHRPSDPIGGAVFVDRPPVFPRAAHPGADPGDVDRPLLDPVFPRAAGDPCHPRIRGHSRYFTDPAFEWTADALQRGTLPRSAGAVSWGGDGVSGRA